MDQNTVEEIIKLSQNENPFGPSPMALKAIMKRDNTMNRYPEPHSKTLIAKFAKHLGLAPDNIFVSAGSIEALDILIRNFIAEDENLIIPKITFVAYKLLAKVFGVETRFSRMKNYRIDIDSIIENYNEKTRLIILANPNNPTGTIVTEGEMVKLLETVSPNTLVVADEAYCDYVDDAEYPDTMKLQKKYPNLIVLRTFSKIYGLAGLRVGFAIASKEIIEKFNYYQAPFTVNYLATVAASAAIKDVQFVKDSFDVNLKCKNLLIDELTELGYKVVPSQSNFIYIYFNTQHERDSAFDHLGNKNVLIRKTDPFGDDKAFRITIPKPENCQKVIDCLGRKTVIQ